MSGEEMTAAVRKGEELQEENLKRFLVRMELINSEKSKLIVSQFYNGYSNLTYLLKIEDKEYVL
ncbi:MAG: phosphotransferase family protein, partial [Maribacter sp.]|nr:phosphotransferase family protein [Maribacter sp.]